MRTWRLALVLLLVGSALIVIPGEGEANVPGDIGRIAFLSTRDHAFGEIYVRDFSGSTPTRLTNNTYEEMSPRWSPDGGLIAFSRNFGTEFNPQLDAFVINPDGSGEANLTGDLSYDDFVTDWSPDGTWILFTSDRGGNLDIWKMRPDGSDPQQLTNSATEEWGPVWSPDGSTIAFCTGLMSSHIWLMDPDGSNQRQLASTTDGCDPSWSPDGSQIAYDSHASGVTQIWLVDADGSNPINLTNAVGVTYQSPSWSPDGSKIAFMRQGMDWELMMINPDGTGLEVLTNSPTTHEWDVDWESVNRLPFVVNDEATVHRGQSVEIAPLHNDSDPDLEPLELGDITRMPEFGAATIEPGGIVTYAHDGSPPPGGHSYPYTDSFDYRVDDARLGSSYGTVTIDVYPYFDDVPETQIFFEDVLWLAAEGITFGCNPPDNTLFCVGDYVTRGQMAAFLVRARGYTDGVGADLFVDDNGSVFETSIDLLGTAGVTAGCNPPHFDRFCPTAHVTRGQMAAFLVRAFGLDNLGMHDLFIDDDDSVFEDDIDKLGATGVTRGCNAPDFDRFCPRDYVTRGQMAAFIRRAVSWSIES